MDQKEQASDELTTDELIQIDLQAATYQIKATDYVVELIVRPALQRGISAIIDGDRYE